MLNGSRDTRKSNRSGRPRAGSWAGRVAHASVRHCLVQILPACAVVRREVGSDPAPRVVPALRTVTRMSVSDSRTEAGMIENPTSGSGPIQETNSQVAPPSVVCGRRAGGPPCRLVFAAVMNSEQVFLVVHDVVRSRGDSGRVEARNPERTVPMCARGRTNRRCGRCPRGCCWCGP